MAAPLQELPDQRLALAIEQIDATAHGFPSAPQLDQLPSTRGYAHGVSRIANSLIGDGRLILGIENWGLGILFEHLLGAARADPQPAGLIDQSSITE
jgi:hypothetical protein